MRKINAEGMHFRTLNEAVKSAAQSDKSVVIDNCMGQRYIAAGLSGADVMINGTPGNALGAYLNGADITVSGNVQDAVGDTMNDGRITVYGSAGDALGYAMRGGRIYIKGNAGYRTGIHMKEYKDKVPVIVLGGSAGSFLGEYMAGGVIIVLGLDTDVPIVGNFTGTGMHGGRIFLRSKTAPKNLPEQVSAHSANREDMAEISDILKEYADVFSLDFDALASDDYCVLKPNAKNPYKRMYTPN
ncbi:MAG: glutamate synthase [Clostridia bacterium]|jgi:glutamate synthase domain-containing protein 3|nr:glutamate synthase [Clostridia bacterium]MBQ4249091.1 glutamate synthase [Clostridia bacterium]